MNMSPGMKKMFTDEIRFILKNMRNTNVPKQKWYFFSATHAMALRILNIEYDPELLLIFQVLQTTYNTINGRLAALSTGQEVGVGMPDGLISKIEGELENLLNSIDAGEKTYPILQRIANIAYSTTGNGYYLYLKGMLKI